MAGADRRLRLYPLGGGEAAAVRGAAEADVPVRFSPDGRSLYVFSRDESPKASIFRVDLSSGNREPWKDLSPPDAVGIHGISRVFLSADGQSYVYTYVRLLDELYLVDGLS